MPEGEEVNSHTRANQPHLLGLTWINSVPIMGILRRKIHIVYQLGFNFFNKKINSGIIPNVSMSVL